MVIFLVSQAILESQCFPSAPACTLTFYYHMYGALHSGPIDGMGWLEVEVKDLRNTDKAGWQLVWLRRGNQGNAWHRADVDLSVRMDNQCLPLLPLASSFGFPVAIMLTHVIVLRRFMERCGRNWAWTTVDTSFGYLVGCYKRPANRCRSSWGSLRVTKSQSERLMLWEEPKVPPPPPPPPPPAGTVSYHHWCQGRVVLLLTMQHHCSDELAACAIFLTLSEF